MSRFKSIAVVVGLLVAAWTWGSPLEAQATRTWVSGVGDDVNPCSRTAPCKTFAGAISKTAAGGVIDVLDPGAFGAVTITKSITIENDGMFAGVLATLNTSGIIVNAGANDIVTLRGLTLDGVGTGGNGVRFLAGGVLHVDNCRIRGFRSASAGSGHGIAFQPAGASELYVTDTVIQDNGTGSNGGGLLVKPSGTGSAKVSLTRVTMVNNVFGAKFDGSVATGAAGISVGMHESLAAGNSFSGITALGGSQAVNVLMASSSSDNNGTTGILSSGLGAEVFISDVRVTGNATGLQATAPGQIFSFGNNNVSGNTTDGAPTSTPGQI